MSDKEQFESVVNNYHNGMYQGDPDLIRKAFHPEARLQGVMAGKSFYGLTRDNFCKFVTLMPTPADNDNPHDVKFEVLDLTGDQAVLKITDYVFGVWFVDYLSMLKTDDGWKVVNKTYYTDEMPEAPEDAAKLLG